MGGVHALSVHEPVLVNLLGHSAGALLFGIFLALLWRGGRGGALPVRLAAAAVSALFWNAASLVLLASPARADVWAMLLTILATSALSLLPALLLDLSLEGRPKQVVVAGYVLSAAAILLHASEALFDDPSIHRRTLLLTAAGFALLTLVGGASLLRRGAGERRLLTSRAVGAMALVLFSLTFAHFHEEGAQSAWPAELALHHAGIPLALFVLSQNYRFVLLDAFLRFLANILLAGLFTFALWKGALAMGWEPSALANDPRLMAAAAMAVCAVLVLYALTRAATQRLLTRLLFRRPPLERTLRALRQQPVEDEERFLEWAAGQVASHFRSESHAWITAVEENTAALPDGEGVAVGVRGPRALKLSRRSGGQRYLSEDLEELTRLAAVIAERLEQFRESELKRLVSQAELRALQSQINPHFLFNALNTLYGVIPREAGGARRTVLNLADIFRYFLRGDQTFIALEEEMEIVRAYLEIEALRLGHKLRTEISVAPEARGAMIPILSVEPLVENAVKHGVARVEQGGVIRVAASMEDGGLDVTVSDTGRGFREDELGGAGMGLDNVRRRLKLCYGAAAALSIETGPSGTTVRMRVPGPPGRETDAGIDRR